MASGDLGTFSVKDFDIIVGGYKLSGFAEEIVRVSQDEDTFTDMQGTDGETCRILRIKNKVTVVVTLMQTSQSNDWLSGIHLVDKNENKPVPLIIVDRSGRTIVEIPEAWIVKPADTVFAGDHQAREWTIRGAGANIFVGGNS